MSLDIWRKHMMVLYITNILIMVHSVFRVVKYAMGNNDYLLRHEVFMYVFDGMLMLAIMIAFNLVHPSKLSQPGLVSRAHGPWSKQLASELYRGPLDWQLGL